MKQQNQKYYNIILDILRVTACIGIVCTHLWQLYARAGHKIFDIIGNVCHAGANGVAILFCLSGYLTWIGIDKETFNTKSYLKKRFLRLSPAYFAILILYLILELLPFDIGVIRYFTYTNAVIPSGNFEIYNNRSGFWTMSSFALFYLLAPLLKKYIYDLKRAIIILTGMFCFGKAFDFILHPFLVYVGADEITFMEAIFPVGNMYLFFMGIVVYYAIKEKQEYTAILGGTVLISMLVMIEKIDYPFWCLMAAVIIILSSKIQLQIRKYTLLSKLIRQGSLISYEVYLSHFMFIEIMKRNVLPFEPLIIITATILFSLVLHKIIDIAERKLNVIKV